MIEPLDSLCMDRFLISGIAALVPKKTPSTLTENICFHSSSEVSSILFGKYIPALFTRISKPP